MQTSLSVAATSTKLNILIDRSIVGALRVPNAIEHLHIADSIVDAQQGIAISGPTGANDFAARSTIEATTILGRCWLQELTLGSEVLFDEVVVVRRKQQGCVRFSYIAPASETPRRYHCIPADDADAGTLARLTLAFTSTRFGDPGYAQLSRNGPIEIATGGSDGSEIGGFFSLKNVLRRQNLVMRLDEYLPFGLAAALIEVT